jgi:hypothetical protein
VHFKAVDEDGATVAEALGSDLMDLEEEADQAAKTAKRVALVDDLRQQMQDLGWTELGVDPDGEWYEYLFGQ